MRFTASISIMLAFALHPGMADAREAAGQAAVSTVKTEFGKIDTSGDGNISLPELIASGMDDLAFRAMDINGDGSLSADEYARRQALDGQPAGAPAKPPK